MLRIRERAPKTVCRAEKTSTATDEMYDFEAVAGVQAFGRVRGAGYHCFVAFDGNGAIDAELVDQRTYGGALFDFERLSVDGDLHVVDGVALGSCAVEGRSSGLSGFAPT